MENKEERICICKLEGNATESVCGGSITRQEAVRKMCDTYFKAKDKGVTESERVEAALNALLRNEK